MKSIVSRQSSRLGGLLLVALAAFHASAFGQDISLEERIAALEGQASGYVDNSYLFLIGGLIVMFMAVSYTHQTLPTILIV